MLLVWLGSGFVLRGARRGTRGAAEGTRLSGLITPIYLGLAALGIFAAVRLPPARVSWPGILPVAVILFGLGLTLQWYASVQTLVLPRTNAPGSAEDRYRYRF